MAAKVKEVKVQEVSLGEDAERSEALKLKSRWTALGSVGHWGHIHSRVNQYEANITIEPIDGAWKIIDLEVLDESRLDAP